jgi:hypothetical protein
MGNTLYDNDIQILENRPKSGPNVICREGKGFAASSPDDGARERGNENPAENIFGKMITSPWQPHPNTPMGD